MVFAMIDRLVGRRQPRVEAVREVLLDRIRNGLLRPGDRFVSARVLAKRYAVKYQTGDRVLSQLEEEGYVVRSPPPFWQMAVQF
jgi:DNA-binding GntR family transcriptional regulator